MLLVPTSDPNSYGSDHTWPSELQKMLLKIDLCKKFLKFIYALQNTLEIDIFTWFYGTNIVHSDFKRYGKPPVYGAVFYVPAPVQVCDLSH